MKTIVELSVLGAFLAALALTLLLNGCAVSTPMVRDIYTTNINGTATSVREVSMRNMVLWPARPIHQTNIIVTNVVKTLPSPATK